MTNAQHAAEEAAVWVLGAAGVVYGLLAFFQWVSWTMLVRQKSMLWFSKGYDRGNKARAGSLEDNFIADFQRYLSGDLTYAQLHGLKERR